MKAIVYTEYGSPDVLQLREVEKPTPKDHEVLIRIYTSSVGYGDVLARKFGNISLREFNMPAVFFLPARMEFGWHKPRKTILGAEFAGEVEVVGKRVTTLKKGDPVFGYRGATMGANAEYLCMDANGLVTLKPANMTYEEASTMPYGALTALTLLRKVNIEPGHKVLINGASGIGSAALQLAKYFGAEVTGVCSTPRLDVVKGLGADRVIDYTQEDFTASSERYDLIVDILGKGSFSRARRVLNQNGRYLFASFKMKQVLQMLWTSRMSSRKVICALSDEKPADLVFIRELIEAGHLKTIIDRCYPLEQAAEAHRHIETRAKAGSVVLAVAPVHSFAEIQPTKL